MAYEEKVGKAIQIPSANSRICVDDQTIEAIENEKILLNGEEVKTFEDTQRVMAMLIKGICSLARSLS